MPFGWAGFDPCGDEPTEEVGSAPQVAGGAGGGDEVLDGADLELEETGHGELEEGNGTARH